MLYTENQKKPWHSCFTKLRSWNFVSVFENGSNTSCAWFIHLTTIWQQWYLSLEKGTSYKLVIWCISQLRPRPPDPRGIVGDSGDLTRPMWGLNTHLTTCCSQEAVELTRRLFHPGLEREFNAHAFTWKRWQQREIVSFFSLETVVWGHQLPLRFVDL